MLRLIMKNGGIKVDKRFSDEPETINLMDFRVFEIDHPELEKFILNLRTDNKPLTLLGIETFTPPPKPAPVIPQPITTPAPATPESQAALKEALLAKRKAARGGLMRRLLGVKPKPDVIALPG